MKRNIRGYIHARQEKSKSPETVKSKLRYKIARTSGRWKSALWKKARSTTSQSNRDRTCVSIRSWMILRYAINSRGVSRKLVAKKNGTQREWTKMFAHSTRNWFWYFELFKFRENRTAIPISSCWSVTSLLYQRK